MCFSLRKQVCINKNKYIYTFVCKSNGKINHTFLDSYLQEKDKNRVGRVRHFLQYTLFCTFDFGRMELFYITIKTKLNCKKAIPNNQK